MNIRRVGIILKKDSPEALRAAEEIVAWFKKRSIATIINQVTADLDLLVILGGDGTLLHVAAEAGRLSIPVLGINMGDLGFLTETAEEERIQVLADHLEGRCSVQNRMLVEARIPTRDDASSFPLMHGLNEVLLCKNESEQLLEVSVWAGDDYITTYRADGVILSSPTGSTAYNLSAGGPIIDPRLQCLLLTPVCPFMLGSRPLVLPPDIQLSCRLKKKNESARVIIDGRLAGEVRRGEVLQLRAAPFTLRLVCPPGKNFFEILRTKLHWGSGHGPAPPAAAACREG